MAGGGVSDNQIKTDAFKEAARHMLDGIDAAIDDWKSDEGDYAQLLRRSQTVIRGLLRIVEELEK